MIQKIAKSADKIALKAMGERYLFQCMIKFKMQRKRFEKWL